MSPADFVPNPPRWHRPVARGPFEPLDPLKASVTVMDDRGVALSAATTGDGAELSVRGGDVSLTVSDAADVAAWLGTVPALLEAKGVRDVTRRSHERRDRVDGATTFRAGRVGLVVSPARGGVRLRCAGALQLSAGTCADVADVLRELVRGAA